MPGSGRVGNTMLFAFDPTSSSSARSCRICPTSSSCTEACEVAGSAPHRHPARSEAKLQDLPSVVTSAQAKRSCRIHGNKINIKWKLAKKYLLSVDPATSRRVTMWGRRVTRWGRRVTTEESRR